MRVRYCFFYFSLSGLLLWGGRKLMHSLSWFELSEIIVEGNRVVSSSEVIELSQIGEKSNIFKIDLDGVKQRIEKDRRIEKADVSRGLLSKIRIRIQEKSPTFLINLSQLYGITQDWEIIPLAFLKPGSDLPIVTGVKPDSFSVYQRLKIPEIRLIQDLYIALNRADPNFLDLVSEINIADPGNLILFLLKSGVCVNLGCGEFEKKLRKLQTVLTLESEIETLGSIDLRFARQAVLRKKTNRLGNSVR